MTLSKTTLKLNDMLLNIIELYNNQHNDIQYTETHKEDTQHNDNKHRDNHQNDT